MSNFDKLFKKIMCECNQKLLKETKEERKRIVKEGLFTGDNNFSLNVSGNDVNVSDNNTDLSLPLPIGEDGDQNCSVCHGTGYIKSHSDEPDQPCPHCNSAVPDDIGLDSDNTHDPEEVTDGQIDAIIDNARRKRLGINMYNQSNKKQIVKESSIVLPDQVVKCEICGKDITKHVVWDKHYGNQYQSEEKDFYCENPNFEHEHICLDCAEKASQNSGQNILEFIDNNDGESWIACAGCGQLWPENELNDTDGGMTCDDCLNSYASRGQEYTVYHNRR